MDGETHDETNNRGLQNSKKGFSEVPSTVEITSASMLKGWNRLKEKLQR